MTDPQKAGLNADCEFLKALRTEIGDHIKERATYTRAKLAFVVSLLGLGSSSIGTVNTSALLYLAPFVGYLFDLYALAYDFGIKRAGLFILRSPASAPQEVLWQRAVRANRDPFSRIAGPFGSLLVLVAATVVLWRHALFTTPVGGIWLALNMVAIASLWLLGHRLVHKLKRFDEFLKNESLNKPSAFQSDSSESARSEHRGKSAGAGA